MEIQKLIELYGLQPHPEGGYFKEAYRSAEKIPKNGLPDRFPGDRNFSTAIYYLLPAGKKSHLHRISSDEIWHFYSGEPLAVAEISPDGKLRETILGRDFERGQKPQHVVLAGPWFGAYCSAAAGYSFVGCTVAPGFDFADFEMGDRKALLQKFPQARDIIQKLTES